jgi:hypothetical protein
MKPFRGNNGFLNNEKPNTSMVTPNVHSNNITVDGEFVAFSEKLNPNAEMSVTG